jgi:mRNA-degrading endonuclease toxin of MazEF toxin-antitoxin module
MLWVMLDPPGSRLLGKFRSVVIVTPDLWRASSYARTGLMLSQHHYQTFPLSLSLNFLLREDSGLAQTGACLL